MKCVWLHQSSLSAIDKALAANPEAAVVFVFDAPSLQATPLAFHRLDFIYQSVAETFVAIPNRIKEIRAGDTVTEILEFCREYKCTEIHVTDNPEPAVRDWEERLERHLPVYVYDRDELTNYADEPRRFSRYWERTSTQVLGYSAKQNRKMR
jgi:deoxyribodipyrimidine photo-lyase